MLLGCIIAALFVARADAKSEVKQKIHFQLKRYYHADGFIKSIGHAAYTTIYSSNAIVRFKWKGALRHLILVREDSSRKIANLKQQLIPKRPPHYTDWLCIHRGEGSWTDGGGPYYGGLQMDLGFQETYGKQLLESKGTADHWTPLEQMWVAERALRSRGFWPWPNTARMCGLI